MRVIAGTARGLVLDSPKNQDIRPTLDRVRETVFNILAPSVEGCRFLDVFAGTGANGIEALSRGAAHAVFVDSSPASLRMVNVNLEKTRLGDSGTVIQASLPGGLSRIAHNQRAFNIVYADPPFNFGDYAALLSPLLETNLVAEDGLCVLEHSKRSDLPDSVGILTRTRVKEFGETHVSFYEPITP